MITGMSIFPPFQSLRKMHSNVETTLEGNVRITLSLSTPPNGNLSERVFFAVGQKSLLCSSDLIRCRPGGKTRIGSSKNGLITAKAKEKREK
ncbi:hypothetical protein TNCT_710971 [Trichonephila clavata]|uniref:Uncharacterized protein n=1 Tax=Trichonephila clavata TaxID=2740835 RepID=A0A8X6FGB0_TRICU|nr:hypothetical protein TNCT_710971 [Trichonephila clavata]